MAFAKIRNLLKTVLAGSCDCKVPAKAVTPEGRTSS